MNEELTDLKVLRDNGTDLMQFVSSCFLCPRGGGPGDIINSATISFVNTGTRKFCVTNAHVYRAFEREKAKNPEVELWMSLGPGHQPICISKLEIIDDGGRDIDLICIEGLADLEDYGKQYFNQPWPPVRVELEDRVILVGFPGAGRNPNEAQLELFATVFDDHVSSVQEPHFYMVDVNVSRKNIQLGGQGTIPEFVNFGGMSGSAVYKVLEDSHVALAGFMYGGGLFEAGAVSLADDLNTNVYVHHAHFIRADGTLDRQAMAWL